MKTTHEILSWSAQLAAAAILGQTLFFKFSGAPESVEIFSRLGVEPWGRLATGVLELAAVVLLLVPATAVVGAALAAALMAGAILSHLAWLGIDVRGDGGLLFGLACAVLAAALLVLVLRRQQIFGLAAQITTRRAPSPALADADAEDPGLTNYV